MESKMIFDEARDEKVAVVVTRLQAKIQGDTTSPAGFFQQLGLELALQKLVVRALIDPKHRSLPAAALDEGARVVVPPERTIRSKISRQRFFSPGGAHRRADGGKRRHGFVNVRIFEREGQRAVPAHGMAEDTRARGIDGKLGFDQRG